MEDVIGVFVMFGILIFLYQFLKRNVSTEKLPVQQATCRIVSKRKETTSMGIGNKMTRFW